MDVNTVMNLAGLAIGGYTAYKSAQSLKEIGRETEALNQQRLATLARSIGIDEQRMALMAKQYGLLSEAGQRFLDQAMKEGASTEEAVRRWIGGLTAYARGDRPEFAYKPGLDYLRQSETDELSTVKRSLRDDLEVLGNLLPRGNAHAFNKAITAANVRAADSASQIKSDYTGKRQTLALGIDQELRTALSQLPKDRIASMTGLGSLGLYGLRGQLPTSEMRQISGEYGEDVRFAAGRMDTREKDLAALLGNLTTMTRPEEKEKPLFGLEQAPGQKLLE
jgi:hypothetical protein